MKTNAQTEEMATAPSWTKKKCGLPWRRPFDAVRVEGRRREDAEQNDAEEAADAVDAPDVERVVPAEPVLERHRVEADDARDEADEAGGRRRDVAGGGRDRGEAGDGAGQQPEELRLLRR